MNDDGDASLSDAVHLLGHLFLGGPPPEEPFVGCGRDLTADVLECDVFLPCDPQAGSSLVTLYGEEFLTDGIFFVIEASGRMADAGPLPEAQGQAIRNLADLRDGTSFSIAVFSSGVSGFPADGGPAVADAETRQRAMEFVAAAAPGNRSCCREGLAAGLASAEASAAARKVLVLVSDGSGRCEAEDEESYLARTLANITAMNDGSVEIHTFRFLDPDPLNEAFLRDLAGANGGSYQRLPWNR